MSISYFGFVVFSSFYIADNLLRQSSYDLFVYIEDEKLIAVYKKIILKLLGQNTKIGKIYPMKSKSNVLSAFDQWKDTKIDDKKSVFIVDRDFDHLLDISVPNHPNLIELEYYTIENYLISFEGVINLVQFKISRYSEEEIKQMLNWSEWNNYINKGFEDLFLAYAIAHKHNLGKNCSLSPNIYLKKGCAEIDEIQINQYIANIKVCYQNLCNGISYEKECELIRECFIENGVLQYEKLIKGKYKHVALFKYLNSIFKKRFDEDLSNGILVDHLDLNRLEFMKNKLISI